MSDFFWSDTDFVVPKQAQGWILDVTGDMMLNELHYLIDKHHVEIRKVMTRELEYGFHLYGSMMYNWTQEERLIEVLKSLAGAAVYLTSGPVNEPVEGESDEVNYPE